MTTCASCGHEQGEGRFCSGCGAPVAAAATRDVTATAVQPAVLPVSPAPTRVPPAARRGVPGWLPWLLGWLVLAVVAAMVGWSLGSDPDAPLRSGAGSTDLPADAGDAGDMSDVTGTATPDVPETAPANRSIDGDPVTYDAAHLLDGDPATAWRMPGDGTGAVLTFRLPGPTRLASVGLVNGYAKVDGPVDWYPRNRRVEAVTWGFDDGTTLRQDLIENPSMQTVAVDDVVTSSVTLTLTSVSAPGAEDGRDFTPVSDVRLIGVSD